MSITKKSSTLLVAVIAVTSFVSGAAYAQQAGDGDALSHTSTPRADAYLARFAWKTVHLVISNRSAASRAWCRLQPCSPSDDSREGLGTVRV